MPKEKKVVKPVKPVKKKRRKKEMKTGPHQASSRKVYKDPRTSV